MTAEFGRTNYIIFWDRYLDLGAIVTSSGCSCNNLEYFKGKQVEKIELGVLIWSQGMSNSPSTTALLAGGVPQDRQSHQNQFMPQEPPQASLCHENALQNALKEQSPQTHLVSHCYTATDYDPKYPQERQGQHQS